MGADQIDAGGWGGMVTAATEEELEEAYELTEKHGTYVRLEGSDVRCRFSCEEVRESLVEELAWEKRRGRRGLRALLYGRNAMGWKQDLEGVGWTTTTVAEQGGEASAADALSRGEFDLFFCHPSAGTWTQACRPAVRTVSDCRAACALFLWRPVRRNCSVRVVTFNGLESSRNAVNSRPRGVLSPHLTPHTRGWSQESRLVRVESRRHSFLELKPLLALCSQ